MARTSAATASVVAEVVGTGCDGTEPSLLLTVRRHGVYSADATVVARLLFNCGEGTQRLCGENGVKLRSLDTVFFTRFDAKSVSGVPGVVFSLGGLGAPRLRLYGPEGLAGFLTAIRSFVRRKYPEIECVHVTASAKDDSRGSGNAAAENGSEVQRQDWPSGEQLVDDHARIAAFVLQASSAEDDEYSPALCQFCDHKEMRAQGRAHDQSAKQSTRDAVAVARSNPSADFKKHRASGDDEHMKAREWLVKFYSAKEPTKVPYVDVVLNRYRGRYDELKMQLQAKYGSIGINDEATAEAAKRDRTSASSSSSDDSSDSDSDAEGDESGAPTGSSVGVIDRNWLVQFYREHQPDKVLHADKVLKQFQGREETLKQMLMQKYGVSSDGANGKSATVEPQRKKAKLDEDTNPASVSVDPTTEIPVILVTDDDTEANDSEDERSLSTSVCYAVWFHKLESPLPVVWIIDCQSERQIPSLIAQFPVRARDCPHKPTLVVHFTPVHVRRNPRYAKWMANISVVTSHDSEPHSQHLVFDGERLQAAENGVFSLSFLASAKASVRRDRAEPRDSLETEATASHLERHEPPRTVLAKLSDFLNSTTSLPPHNRQRQILLQGGVSAHIAQSKLEFAVVKHRTGGSGFNYERTGWARFTSDEDVGVADSNESESNGERVPRLTAERAQEPPQLVDQAKARRRLIVLGTGSAAPSKLRASSSIYVEIGSASPDEAQVVPAVLLDCGEGSFGQLWRQFGAATPVRIGGLRCIWVSHHHADHQCGLVRILHEYCRYFSGEASATAPTGLVVIAPQSVLSYVAHWLPYLSAQHGSASGLITTVTCREFNDHAHPVRSKLLRELGFAISGLYSVPVRHCYDAYGLVITSSTGRKLVYSGDTQPCDRLVRAGMDASLLIHEATFDDAMEQDAVAKRHSTVGQALEVARRMNAASVILTHFSQRYPSLPPTSSADSSADTAVAGRPGSSVDCAFDGYAQVLTLW